MFSEHLDLQTLNSLLTTEHLGKAPGWANEVWATIDSTNTRALDLARQGAPAGVVVAARQQTAGKGRLGRAWMSPADCGLYLSILLRPQLQPNVLPLLSFAAGVAMVKAIEQVCGISIQLKWVNDIVYGGKKVGGILAETISSGTTGKHPVAVAIGIGLNLKQPAEFPEELKRSAGWLEELCKRPIDANQLAAMEINCLERWYQVLLQGGQEELLSLWKQHAATLGKRIRVIEGTREFEGLAQDIASDGALQVLLESGQLVTVYAADVSIRNADGSYA